MNKSATQRRYRPLALLMLVLYLTGCHSWQPIAVSPRQFIEEEQPDQLRIFQADGERTEGRNPSVEADSISFRVPSALFGSETARIALSDITAVEAWHFSIGKTVSHIAAAMSGLAASLDWGTGR